MSIRQILLIDQTLSCIILGVPLENVNAALAAAAFTTATTTASKWVSTLVFAPPVFFTSNQGTSSINKATTSMSVLTIV